MAYNVVVTDENIFADTHFFKLHCIGKTITEKFGRTKVTYFFKTHGNKYIVEEDVSLGSRDCNIKIEKVDEFDLLPADKYFMNTGQRKDTSAELETLMSNIDKSQGKNGYYLFSDFHTHQGMSFGGIMDVYDYKLCICTDLAEKLREI